MIDIKPIWGPLGPGAGKMRRPFISERMAESGALAPNVQRLRDSGMRTGHVRSTDGRRVLVDDLSLWTAFLTAWKSSS